MALIEGAGGPRNLGIANMEVNAGLREIRDNGNPP
jgi:hypothetical protein